MKESNSKIIRILIWVLLIAIVILSIHNCSKRIDESNKIDYLTDSLRYYKNRSGKQVAQITALKGEKSDLQLMLSRSSQQLDSLVKEFKKIDAAGEVETITKIDTVKIRYTDTIPYQFEKRFSINKKHYSLSGISNHRGIDIEEINVPNTLSFAVGKVRKGYEIRVVNSNPYIKTTGLNSYVLEQRNRRIGLGFQAGYGLNKDGVSPYIGLGVSYNLIQF